MKHLFGMAALALALLLPGLAAGTVIIDRIPVGNAGNAPDTRYNSISVGAVAYNFWIGKYEVTAGQYCEFLNAVAATDTYGAVQHEYVQQLLRLQDSQLGSSGSYTYLVNATAYSAAAWTG